ncbi:hypothetical protein Q9R29_02810 [Rothia sp. ARF10]|nr:hypothetical protein [Rothia sp. ARF10]
MVILSEEARVNVADAARFVDAQVGPLLSVAGFAEAAMGVNEGRTQILYCADLRAVRRQVPGLPDGHEADAPVGACFDVMIELHADRLADVHMDGGSLETALDIVKMADLAGRLRDVLGRPVQDAAPVVAEAVRALFVNLPQRLSSEQEFPA